ncbi:MAG TPA: hypothetical protein VJZ71_08825 [Phycisphaerae bacterium]|nr:hypothetical protein [Phycisphaerae bacterium]
MSTADFFLLFIAALTLGSSGCVAHGTSAGRDADASISGLRADVREINAAMVQLKSDVRAGRDVNTNDKWTLRLLGLGVMLLGLSYPIGKMLWLATGAIQRKARWMVLAASRARTDRIHTT